MILYIICSIGVHLCSFEQALLFKKVKLASFWCCGFVRSWDCLSESVFLNAYQSQVYWPADQWPAFLWQLWLAAWSPILTSAAQNHLSRTHIQIMPHIWSAGVGNASSCAISQQESSAMLIHCSTVMHMKDQTGQIDLTEVWIGEDESGEQHRYECWIAVIRRNLGYLECDDFGNWPKRT